MNEIRPESSKESGQSLVELVMSLLFLTLLVAGVVDLGRAFFTYIALRDAAQEGAAFASIAREYQTDTIDSAYCQSIVTRAQQTSNTQIVDLTQTTVNVTYGGVACGSASNSNACFGQTIQVVVTHPNFPLATPFLGSLLGSQTIPIQASIFDSVLTPPCH